MKLNGDKADRLTDEEIQAVEFYQGAAEVIQNSLDNSEGGSGWASVLTPRNVTPEQARALEYVIYFDHNVLTAETLKALDLDLKAEGLRYHFKAVGSVNNAPDYGRDAIAIRPRGMYQQGEEMRAGNLRMLITVEPMF